MPDPIETRILEKIRSSGYKPMNKSEFARELGLKPKERADLRAVLTALEREGTLMRLKKGRYVSRASAGNVLIGPIHFDFKGNAHVFPDKSDPENRNSGFDLDSNPRIYVPAKHTHVALHGDIVAIRVEKSGPPVWHKYAKHKQRQAAAVPHDDGQRLVGKVVRIIQRADRDIVGTFESDGRFNYVKPDDTRLPPTIEIPVMPARDDDGKQPASAPARGDKVLVHIEEWDSQYRHPHGKIVHVIGPGDAPGMDILSVIYQYHLPLEFPRNVLKEAESISDVITDEDLEDRDDWRDKPVITIDPFDARDFDDAIHVEEIEDGGWELAVHIADVSHYVKPGSALDKEAVVRGNSVYLVDRVIPMLPGKLSNGICSLNPDVDRLTHLVLMRFDAEGNRVQARFCKSVIRNFCRLAYEEAYQRMQGNGPKDEVTDHLNRAWKLAAVLRKKRFDSGGMNLDFPETKVILDENGVPTELRRIEYDESHQLIEEFMLAANEAVAETTKNKSKPSVYRVHEDPDEEKLIEFRELAMAFGFSVGNLTHRAEIQKLLDAVQGKPEEHAIKIGLLKSLKRAAYSADPKGHYGLAKVNYTHFTSPIRRYADLIVHRVLTNIEDELAKRPASDHKPKKEELDEVARHISTTERTAADAEMETRRIKETEYFARLLYSREQRVFEARITEVRRMGLFIELVQSLVRGVVHTDDLPPDDYYFDIVRQSFKGRRKENRFQVGDSIDVMVASVNTERRQIDFCITRDGDDLTSLSQRKQASRRKSARNKKKQRSSAHGSEGAREKGSAARERRRRRSSS